MNIMSVRTNLMRGGRGEQLLELKNLSRDESNDNLRVTRSHGNYIENAPMFSILLVMADACDCVPKSHIDVMGGLFLISRLMHAVGLGADDGATVGRMVGSISTMLSLVLAAGACLYSYVCVLQSVEKNYSMALLWHRALFLVAVVMVAKVVGPIKVSPGGGEKKE